MTDQPTCRQCDKPITFRQKASGEGWDRFNPDGTPHVHERRGGGGGKSLQELRDIRRLSVLKSAAEFAASRPGIKSADVLAIAGRWLAWVEEKGGDHSTGVGSDIPAAHSHRTQGLERNDALQVYR